MKRDFQDKTFTLCYEHKEFREYITGIPDLEECPEKEIIDVNYEGIKLDSLFKSSSLDILVNIEHQSSINNDIMFRNLRYYVNTKNKHKKPTRLYIFHTGQRLAPIYYIYDDQVLHLPYLKQTYENDGVETFKRIKNKLNHNKTIHPSDIFDLIWLPTFRNMIISEEFLKEYVDITKQLKNNKFYTLLIQVVFGWVNLLTDNEETIEYATEGLKMMSTNSIEFKKYIATAIAEREINKLLAEKDKEINELKQKLAQKE